MVTCESSLILDFAPANCISLQEVRAFVMKCVEVFPDELRVNNVDSWINKLKEHADCCFAKDVDGNMVAAAFAYLNDMDTLTGYLTLICKLPGVAKGVATKLHDICIRVALSRGLKRILLEVVKTNANAIDFYFNLGYRIIQDRAERCRWLMELSLDSNVRYVKEQ